MTIIKIKHQPKAQMVEEFLYSSWLWTSNNIMDMRIANSGATTSRATSHWYLDPDAKTISFRLFRLEYEKDFRMDLFDEDECFVETETETEAGDSGDTLSCVLVSWS